MRTQPVAILGAGLAGLTAAAELRRQGVEPIVFEAGATVGGLAASFTDEHGFRYDCGAHFISNRLADALGGRDRCRTVRVYGESVALRSGMRSHPFGLLREPRFLADALRARSRRARTAKNAADHFRQAYGEALAREVAIPLAEAWSGADAGELAPSVGEKFGNGIVRSLYLSAAARLTRRAVCNGYTREMPEGAGVYHVYPEGGLSTLLEPMARELGPAVRLRTRVEKIIVENGRVAAVRAGGDTVRVAAAISTAPVNVLPRMVEGSDALGHLFAFRYRPMVFVNLRYEGRNILPATMLWVPDRREAFFRVTEAPISMPWLAPEGKTLLTFDIGSELDERYWSMEDHEIAELCRAGLERILPRSNGRCLGVAGVVRTPFAYPVHLGRYEPERVRFADDTGVAGLSSIGRNGEFAHILMEDVYWRARRRALAVARELVGPPRPASAGHVDGGAALDWLGSSLPQPMATS